jgi:hypothetical protein
MDEGYPGQPAGGQLTDADRDRIIQVLSLEYQTLREDILVRASGRFQFLGLMTTAAALVASGVVGHSAFSGQGLLSAILATAVFVFGLSLFLLLGRQMSTASAHVARLEARINALLPAEADSLPPLTLETLNQRHSFVGYLSLGVIPGHPPRG